MMVVPEPFPRGKRLRPVKELAMSSRLSKRTVLPREKPSHDKHSPPIVAMNADDGTIGTTSRKSTLQIPFPGTPTVGVFCTGKT
jgi:hypothetical protein